MNGQLKPIIARTRASTSCPRSPTSSSQAPHREGAALSKASKSINLAVQLTSSRVNCGQHVAGSNSDKSSESSTENNPKPSMLKVIKTNGRKCPILARPRTESSIIASFSLRSNSSSSMRRRETNLHTGEISCSTQSAVSYTDKENDRK